MTYLGYLQYTITDAVFRVFRANMPANATHVDVQVETHNVRYRMDGGDPTATKGMLLIAQHDPITFSLDQLVDARFFAAQNDAILNLHFFAGRDV